MPDVDTDSSELVYTRVFDAPRELVYTCMTTPEHLTRFWGPTGMSAPLEEIVVEPWPGGRFETVMVNDADGSRFPTSAVFVEVSPPERLVFREPVHDMTTTSTFTDLGDGRTEVRIVQSNVPAFFRNPDAQAGFRTSLDKFAAYLATL